METMCNYCNLNTDKDFDYVVIGDLYIEYEKENWYIAWGCWDKEGREEINYCPKCGRKLTS